MRGANEHQFGNITAAIAGQKVDLSQIRRGSGLSVATYNIHRCIGSDGRYDPGRIREVLHQLDADVIALQEVERFDDDPGLLDYLCDGSDWKAIHGVTLKRDGGEYGNALLTRLPVKNLWRQELTYRQREPRGAIHARLRSGEHDVLVIATHLGLRPAERRHQARLLAKALEGREEVAVASPRAILLGDFNEWWFTRRTLRHLQQTFMPVPAPSTWPSRRPVFALDRIWSTPDLPSVAVERVNTPLTRIASDHLPLRARFLG